MSAGVKKEERSASVPSAAMILYSIIGHNKAINPNSGKVKPFGLGDKPTSSSYSQLNDDSDMIYDDDPQYVVIVKD